MTAAEVRAAAFKRHYEPRILDNARRGDIAEEIVAGILDPDWKYCGGAWAGWDFEHRGDGTRLQLKQSAALQTWTRKDVYRPEFGIKWQKGYYANGIDWIQAPTATRYAHIYVFAWHGKTDETCDQADPAQWRFYAVPTTELPVTETVRLAVLAEQRPADEQDTLAAAVEAARRNLVGDRTAGVPKPSTARRASAADRPSAKTKDDPGDLPF